MNIRTVIAVFAALLFIGIMPLSAQEAYNDFLKLKIGLYNAKNSIETQNTLISGSPEIPAAQNAENQIKDIRESAKVMLSIAECEFLVEQYYQTNIFDLQPALESFERIRESLKVSFDEKLFEHYLEHAKLISILYIYEGNQQCKKYDELIQDEIQELFKQVGKCTGKTIGTKTQTAALYVRYADYLYTKISLPKNTFTIVSVLPVLYRKALMIDPDNIEAAVKLACWHIFPADVSTMNYNSYIESKEEYIELLSAADRFNAYLLYSTYYMRKYESGKGRTYLQKAAALFPDHILLSRIYENYRNGKFRL